MTKGDTILDQYESWATDHLASRTLRLYRSRVQQLLEFAQARGYDIENLSDNEIEKFAGTLRHYAPGTQENFFSALSNFYRFLVETGQRSDIPVKAASFAKRSQKKLHDRRPRPRQVSQRLAKLHPRYRAIALLVSELQEKGANITEIFGIDEKPPVGDWIEVESGRGERRSISISGHARARLNEWGGHLPIGIRAFQRAVEKVGLQPKDLGDPSRPGLADFHLTLLPDQSVHEELERRARPAFLRGEYDTAVFEAMKSVEIAVRHAGAFTTTDIGTPLMRKAFNVSSGPLRDPEIVKAERQATSDLFAGAIGLFKNPSSHRDVNIEDPVEVAGILRLADLLLRIVDRASGS